MPLIQLRYTGQAKAAEHQHLVAFLSQRVQEFFLLHARHLLPVRRLLLSAGSSLTAPVDAIKPIVNFLERLHYVVSHLSKIVLQILNRATHARFDVGRRQITTQYFLDILTDFLSSFLELCFQIVRR